MSNDVAGSSPGSREGSRPLSPHLQVWRWHVTMLGSILHRASGVALYAGAALTVVWLASLAAGPATVTVGDTPLIPRAALFGNPVAFGFAGFHSKDAIIEASYAAGHTSVFWVGVFVALLTSFYSWRLVFLTFHGKPRWAGSRSEEHTSELQSH